MKQLEKRFYPLDELAQAIDRKRDAHFAGNAKNDLTKWGYEYEWHNRRGVEITRRPESAQERLAELMNRGFGLDIQVDVYVFACFLFMLLMVEDFASMPWAVRAEELDYWFGVKVTERTLRRWAVTLFKTDTIIKSKDGTIWRTISHHGEKKRDPIPADDPDYIRYKNRRSELMDEYKAQGVPDSMAWGQTFKRLWGEFDCCYYTCDRIVLNALQEEIDELFKWVNAICLPAYPEMAD